MAGYFSPEYISFGNHSFGHSYSIDIWFKFGRMSPIGMPSLSIIFMDFRHPTIYSPLFSSYVLLWIQPLLHLFSSTAPSKKNLSRSLKEPIRLNQIQSSLPGKTYIERGEELNQSPTKRESRSEKRLEASSWK